MDDRFLDANWRALAATGMARPAGLPAGDRDGGVQREGGTVTGVLLHGDGRLVGMHSGSDPLGEAAALLPHDIDRPLRVIVGAGPGFILDALEARGYQGQALVAEPSPASLVATLAIRCRWLERGTFKYRDAGANPLVAFEASHGDVIA